MAHNQMELIINTACARVGFDRSRLMDVLIECQQELRGINTQAMQIIADKLNTHRVEVEGMVTFYAFFSTEPKGKIIIRLCDDIVDQHSGLKDITDLLIKELGIKIGETTSDGLFSLEYTPCIGMCDQAPATMINDQVFTNLTVDKVKKILEQIKKKFEEKKHQDNLNLNFLVDKLGDGNNNHKLIHSEVKNNIRLKNSLLLDDEVLAKAELGLKTAIKLKPQQIINIIKQSNLRGRGGAGFTTGIKWQSSADTNALQKYIICNADEGEPGTFKDRVLLTERPDLLFEGMTIAAYAIGARKGIIYLRAEYTYLFKYLEYILQQRRKHKLLGQNILNKKGFDFDIRIQLGAGAYICGEESALISSCEGRRGEPKNRPPFPTQVGYLDYPTVVNNVETLCSAARIVYEGVEWFKSFGTEQSSGTKLISICGDCARPGVYEIEFGITVQEMLDLAGAKDCVAAMVGGPSGEIISNDQFQRKIAFEDLATGGALIVFNSTRDLLQIVDYYMKFFVDESCGYCTPCRVGNVFLQKIIEKIRKGQADAGELESMRRLSKTIINTSRCGLGKTSPNPILSTLKNFPKVYLSLIKESQDGMQATFNIEDALKESKLITKRGSVLCGKSNVVDNDDKFY